MLLYARYPAGGETRLQQRQHGPEPHCPPGWHVRVAAALRQHLPHDCLIPLAIDVLACTATMSLQTPLPACYMPFSPERP